jgi:hypothetical protein
MRPRTMIYAATGFAIMIGACAPSGVTQSPAATPSPVESAPSPPGLTATHAADGATELDGRWQACPTEEDILAVGGDPGEARGNAGCTTWTFQAGTFTESGPMAPSGQAGSYEVDGDMITIRRANAEEFMFRWSISGGRLTFADPGIAGAISPAPVIAVPWEPVTE